VSCFEFCVSAVESDGVAALRAKGDLVALVEAYPELKADANFGRLHGELVDTEDRIAPALLHSRGTSDPQTESVDS